MFEGEETVPHFVFPTKHRSPSDERKRKRHRNAEKRGRQKLKKSGAEDGDLVRVSIKLSKALALEKVGRMLPYLSDTGKEKGKRVGDELIPFARLVRIERLTESHFQTH